MAGGAALRAAHLGHPVRYDEAVTFLEYVVRPLGDALARYDLPNNHLFHTLLAHLSISVFGEGPAALRLPAFVAGVLVPPALFAVGRIVHDREAGLVAAGLAAASPVLVLFSANARGYSMVVLAFLAMVPPSARLRTHASPLAWAVLATVAALGAWTMPIMLYPAGAVAAWLLLGASAADGRGAGRVAAEGALAALAGAGLTAVLYLPVLQRWGLEAVVANRFVAPRPYGEFAAAVPGFLADVAGQWVHGLPPAVALLLATGAVVEAGSRLRSLVTAGGTVRTGPPALLPVALTWSSLLLLATRRVPFPRVWLFLLPAALAFSASGLGRLAAGVRGRVGGREPRTAAARPPGETEPSRVGEPGAAAARWVLAAPVVALVLAGWTGYRLLTTDAVRRWPLTGTLPRGDRVAAFLSARWRPGDAVIAAIPSDAPLEFYFRRRGLPRTAVNRLADRDGCVYLVVNRRHGQSLGAVAGSAVPPGAEVRLLREWPGVAVYAAPGRSRAPAGPEGSRGAPRPPPAGPAAAGGESPGRTDSPAARAPARRRAPDPGHRTETTRRP